MTFVSWLRQLASSSVRSTSAQRQSKAGNLRKWPSLPLRLELLETRLAPAVVTVNSLGDYVFQDNMMTLRKAVYLLDNGGVPLAALGRSLSGGETGQISGVWGKADTIVFDPSLSSQNLPDRGPGILVLQSIGDTTFGASALPLQRNVTIDGAAAPGLTLYRDSAPMRLFYISPGVNVTMKNISLVNGFAVGYNGTGGGPKAGAGGGGAGMGGAIFSQGTLTLDSVRLGNNVAQGGNGANPDFSLSGSSTTIPLFNKEWEHKGDLNFHFGEYYGGGGGGGMYGDAFQPGSGLYYNGGKGGGISGGDGGHLGSTSTLFGGNGGPSSGGGGGYGDGGLLYYPGGAGGFGGGGGGGGSANLAGAGGAGGFGGGGGGGAIGADPHDPAANGVGGAGSSIGSNYQLSGNGGNGTYFTDSSGTYYRGGGGGGGAGLGGAIYNAGGSLSVVNSVFHGNHTAGGKAGYGGVSGRGDGNGIYNDSGSLTVTNSTVLDQGYSWDQSGNDVVTFGRVAHSNTVLTNSILLSTTEYGEFTLTGGYDIIYSRFIDFDRSSFTHVGSISQLAAGKYYIPNGNDVVTGDLGDYGGPIPTYILPKSSVAIGMGIASSAPTNDARGKPRPLSTGHVDIGSFQNVEPAVISITGLQGATVGTSFDTTVTVYGTYGNAIPGVTVTFTAPATGASVAFSNGLQTYTATTDSAGVIHLNGLKAGKVAGPVSVQAVTGTLTSTLSLTNTPGSVATLIPVKGTPQSSPILFAYATGLWVRAVDAFNNPVPNVSVTFTVPSSSGSPYATFPGAATTAIIVTDQNGNATAPTLTASSVIGTFAVTASANNKSTSLLLGNTQLTNVVQTWLPFDPLDPLQRQVGRSINKLSYRITANGQPVANANIVFTTPTSGASADFIVSNVYSSEFPPYVRTYTAVTDQNGSISLPNLGMNAMAGSYGLVATFSGFISTLTIGNLPGAPAQVIPLDGSGQSANLGRKFAKPLQVQVLDQYGNPITSALGSPNSSVGFIAPGNLGASARFANFTNVQSVQTDSNGIATVSDMTAVFGAGSYTVQAIINGVSASFALTNIPFVTSTTLSSSNSAPAAGQPVNITATVKVGSDASNFPSGTVRFQVDQGPLSAPVTVVPGQLLNTGELTSVAISRMMLSAGSHKINAYYSGDAIDTSSQALDFTQSITSDATTTVLTASSLSLNVGEAVAFSAAIGSHSSATPPSAGNVQFSIDGVPFGVPADVDAGVAYSLPAFSLAPGHHAIAAHYSGDSSHQPSDSLAINISVSAIPPTLDSFQRWGNINSPIYVGAGDFGASFHSSGHLTMTGVRIESLPQNGSLLLQSNVVQANQFISTSDLSGLVYQPNAGFTGVDPFTWNATDGYTFADNPATASMFVVDQTPTIGDFQRYVPVNQTLYVGSGDFLASYRSPVERPMANVQIGTLPEHGSLFLNNAPVAANQIIDVSTLANLVYVTNANYAGLDTFTWTASDGFYYSTSFATAQIVVLDLAPAVAGIQRSVTENGVLYLGGNDFQAAYSSPTGVPLASVTILAAPAHGTLYLGQDALTAGSEVASVSLPSLIYLPNDQYAGVDTFTWTASDGYLTATPSAGALLFINRIAPTVQGFSRIDINDSMLPLSDSFQGAYSSSVQAPLDSIQILSLPAHGTLQLGGQVVSANQVIQATDLNALAYVPDASYAGADSFTWNGADRNGFADTPATASFTVTNKPATLDYFERYLFENNLLWLGGADFTAAFHSPLGLPLAQVQIVHLPAHGSLYLAGQPVSANQVIPASDLPNMLYFPDSLYVGADYITWNGSDGYAFAPTPATALFYTQDVLPVVQDVSSSVPENSTLQFTPADFQRGYSQAFGAALNAVEVFTLPSHGSITLNGTSVAAGEVIASADLDKLSYTPNTGYLGADSFDWRGADSYSLSLVIAKFNLNVTDIPPTLGDFVRNVPQNQELLLGGADFAAAFHQAAGNALQSVRIDTLPSFGTLVCNTPVVAGQVISVGDLASLVYLPSTGYVGNDSFSWNAFDGYTYSASSATAGIGVFDIPPVVSAFQRSVIEGNTLDLGGADFAASYSSQQNNPLLSVRILSLPSSGSLVLGGVPVSVNLDIPAGALASLIYQPNAGFAGADSFSWTGFDGYTFASAGTSASIVVQHADTSMAVAGSSRSTVYGQSVTFTATVTPLGPGNPTGQVNFYSQGGALLGSAMLSTSQGITSATISTTALRTGSNSITAVFVGDTLFNGSSSVAVAHDVTPATLVVTPNDASKVYGVANPAFTYRITGFVNGDGLAVASGSPTLTSTATIGSEVGNYAISAAKGSLSAADYLFAFTDGTLSVTKASLRVTVADASKVFGQDDSALLTGTIVGLQNNDPIGATYTSPGSSANAALGKYAIDALMSDGGTGKLARDYDVTIIRGSLTVTAATSTTQLSSSANPSNYGQAVTFTAKITANVSGSGTPSGSVTFYDGTTVLGTATLTSGVASLSVAKLAVGDHSIVAHYNGNATFTAGNSATLTQSVLSAQQQASLLIGQINGLVASGVLTGSEAQACTVKLDNAKASFDKGNTNAGVNQVNAFMNQINAFVKSRRLTAKQAQVLLDAANQIIASAQA